MSILITGGAGYIGSHIAVELLLQNIEPILLDNFCNSKKSVLRNIERITGKKTLIYSGNCTNIRLLSEIVEKHSIEGIIHLAAFKAVGESVQKPLDYYENNTGSLLSVLKIVLQHTIHAFVFSSSATVYGEPDTVPITEEAPRKPATSPYGNTKQIGEDMVRDTVFASGGTLRAIALRYFNPVGAHPSGLIGELPLSAPQNLVPYLTQAAAHKRPPLTVFGDDYPTPDGTCIRDYIHVVDLARAHIAALHHLKNAPENASSYDVYNVGTGAGTSVKELITLFEQTTGVTVPHTIGPRRAGDVVTCYADVSKIRRVMGWEAQFPLAEALADAWRWEMNQVNS